ncbi:MAG: sigma-E processing peptidase SpoIIGA [Oscillospiraceae bacterium]|nr:sigma-E processing peptidase SpoIIGA [Oscillospiraceae bacterium]
MTVVYLDSLFLLNFILDYLLLLATAKAADCPFSRLRLALGALVGAGYAAGCFLWTFLALPPVKLCAALLMVLAAFWGERRLLRLCLIFLALSCALGGGILAVSLLGGAGLSLENGIPATGMDVKVLLLSAAGCYVLLTLASRRMGRHSQAAGDLVDVTLELEGRKVALTALIDTGHTLTDPVNHRPVAVAEAEALRGLLPAGVRLTQQDLREPVIGLERLMALWEPKRFRLLPYRAVGVDCGMLLALRVDRITIGGREQKGGLVALSPGPVSDGGGYHILLNSN